MTAAKSKRTLLAIEIPRDELALRIAAKCIGLIPPKDTDPAKALDDMDRVEPGMGQGFRAAADAAVIYFYERINAARQPS